MSAHHVDSPEQVVTPGEELWVKIIDLDLARRRISLSIKQVAEGGELAAEYREHFEVDTEGNYVQGEASAEAEAAWTEYYGEGGEGEGTEAPTGAPTDAPTVAGEVAAALAAAGGATPVEEAPAEAAAEEAPAEAAVEEAPAEAAAEEAPATE
jgi:small subunit ribosomal protein S1